MFVFLANDECSKSNAATEWLEKKGTAVEKRVYLQNPLNREELMGLMEALGPSSKDLLRSKSTENNLEIIDIILKDPSEMQRPVLWNLNSKKAAIGRPLENFESVI